MSDFKQIIRGTRVRDDYGKLFFNILDYTGSATTMFADPDFDGEPANVTEEEIDEHGKGKAQPYVIEPPEPMMVAEPQDPPYAVIEDDPETEPRKYYFDGGQVQVAAHLVYELVPHEAADVFAVAVVVELEDAGEVAV